MQFLEREVQLFGDVLTDFHEAYASIIEEMQDVYDMKATSYERRTGRPLHHRLQPHALAHEQATKARRVASLIDRSNWWHHPRRLEGIIEECIDGANYFLYLAALCRMRIHDLEDVPHELQPNLPGMREWSKPEIGSEEFKDALAVVMEHPGYIIREVEREGAE